ncbi:MAG: response regulator, partial [Blastocatellia bacterium]|nr:response regulator [Blastocatellia bacterium]
LWIGSETGIYKLSPDRNIVTSLDSELLLDINGIGRSVQSIYEDRFSNIWIGTNSGMLRYDPETKTVTNYFSVFNNLPQDHICSFMEDSRGLLWIATKNSGIHYFDRKTNTFGHVSEKDGLAHNNTYGIFEDKEGYLWISSDKGIVKYDHSRKIFKTFGIGDGLQGNEFNRRAFLQAKNGEIFFGGTKGLNSFFPEQIKGNSIEPPVIITSFKTSVDKEPIRVSTEKTVELSHQQNSVRFEFVALDFNAPEQNLYAYKLDGFDNDWIYSKNMHEAIYPNLSWGSYIFRVKATNSDGKWNEVGTTLRFSISPPPWRTWWAYLLYLLLTLLVLYQVFQFQTRKLKTEARIQQAVLRAEVAEAERKIAEAQAKASEMQAQVLERENLQRSQAEAEIKQKNQQLERANLKLQELDQIKATFTAMLVHDLKNPLTVVKGTLELLKENLGKENKIFNNMLNLSEKSLDKMLVMINEVLEFYRSDSHEIKLEREVINSELFLRNISEAARIAALTNSINVTLFIKDSLLDIEGDTQKLERAFSNIISNAIKFTPVGGNITIEASSSQLPTPMVSVCITDSGEGIPPEAIPHLFEPYKQASSSQKKKGVGLGLAIVKKIVTAHQGNISVQSQVGAGSSFTITLPAVAQRQARLVFQESTTGHDIVEVANDKSRLDIKLLIAEDNPTNVKIMQMQLRRLGYEAQFVENGQQAVEAFKNSSYSLILMDCHMPEMDGTEATVLIRQIEKEGRTPIIALTASTSDTKAEECFRAGMDDILAKPFKMEELKKIIERWGTVKENLPS